jgi:tripartite-type tricarboxylate transporter receptor subunit TctC
MAKRLSGRGALAALMGMLALAPARAQDAEKAFFQGKTVRMVVGSGTGGGYDVYARLIAPYLSKVLGTTVIVENRPGAGGLSSMNFLYQAPPDGLALSLANGSGAAFAQITGQQGVRYDLTKFGYLATVGAPPSIWLVGPESPIKSVQQAVDTRQKWRWAASGATSGLAIGAAFTCEALKMDCQVVAGYTGSNQAALALTRGEMDAMFQAESSATHYMRLKEAEGLATMSRVRSRFFPDQPTIFEAVQLDAAWVKRLAALFQLGAVVLWLLAATLAGVVLSVVFNTIRLQVINQSEEISISRLLGATDAFVSRPFYYAGGMLGLAAGSIALAGVFGILSLLNTPIRELATLYGSAFQLEPLNLTTSALLLVASMMLGVIGAMLSVRRALRESD